jgi:uncharacterized BrkB/YihY/UPF0761 family membrane protein
VSKAPGEARGRPGAARIRAVADKGSALTQRGQEWAEHRDPASATGVAVGAWRAYRFVDGPLQSALLALYILVAVLPALLAIEAYRDAHPDSLATTLVRHYHLNGATAQLIHGVLGQDRAHELGSVLLAVASALFFGLAFGRVLQLVYARAWKIELPRRGTDQGLYALVLLAVYGLIFVLLVQLRALEGSPQWAGKAIGLGWIGLLAVFFVWAPWILTHKLVSRRDLVPSGLVTAAGIVVLMLVSNYVMQFWVDLYARDYGGFGVVLAIYFWLLLISGVIVWAAALSPALAERRRRRNEPVRT